MKDGFIQSVIPLYKNGERVIKSKLANSEILVRAFKGYLPTGNETSSNLIDVVDLNDSNGKYNQISFLTKNYNSNVQPVVLSVRSLANNSTLLNILKRVIAKRVSDAKQ